MDYEALYSGQLVFFANCFLTRENLKYGFAYFGSNTPAIVALKDSNGATIAHIEPPPEAIGKNQPICFGDSDGINEVKRLK